jgi:SAM-dependent methyltransferase
VTDELWRPYDRMAAEFLAHAEDGAYNAHYDRPTVLELLGDVSGLRVLDAGCGPGLYAEELLARGAEVVGFDASTAMVDLARARVGDRADISVARLEAPLPYPDDSVDVVLCALAIHYVADRHAAFAEMHRVLRPGGAVVLSTQHPTTDWQRTGGSYFDRVLETDAWSSLPVGRNEVRYWREPLSDLCAAATDSGFVIQRLVEPRPPEIMRERWPAEYDELAQRPGFLALRLLALP